MHIQADHAHQPVPPFPGHTIQLNSMLSKAQYPSAFPDIVECSSIYGENLNLHDVSSLSQLFHPPSSKLDLRIPRPLWTDRQEPCLPYVFNTSDHPGALDPQSPDLKIWIEVGGPAFSSFKRSSKQLPKLQLHPDRTVPLLQAITEKCVKQGLGGFATYHLHGLFDYVRDPEWPLKKWLPKPWTTWFITVTIAHATKTPSPPRPGDFHPAVPRAMLSWVQARIRDANPHDPISSWKELENYLTRVTDDFLSTRPWWQLISYMRRNDISLESMHHPQPNS